MNVLKEQAAAAAQRFYASHEGEHLEVDQDRLIERCTDHLSLVLAIPMSIAQQHAREVWSERRNLGAQAFIDTQRTTSQMVVLCDDVSRTQHVLPVADLLAMVRKRTEAVTS
jgi:hypothetical protein